MKRDNYILTSSGTPHFIFDPRPETIDIEDIAGALSKICRFGGHCREFYSVAEHSVLVSEVVPQEHALAALMHDATEAYIGDVVRPLKRALPEYEQIEDITWAAIAQRFRLPRDMPACVKDADNAVLRAEKLVLMPVTKEPAHGGFWPDIETAKVHVRCLPPRLAREAFLFRFAALIKQRHPIYPATVPA